ncbi:mediator of RNA polymerase II transcription subunit 30-like [Dermacentor albipictus]|uniref:mediator of RNA polymerase II transcription subunit 30-like n=1 Tax=Dermacentor albipictus TaxID=60249 RepID=UPI0038FBF32E
MASPYHLHHQQQAPPQPPLQPQQHMGLGVGPVLGGPGLGAGPGGLGPPLLSPVQPMGGPSGFLPTGPPGPGDGSGDPVAPLQPKDFNTAIMCRMGQEIVQEIVAKAIELFQTLKALQPPTGVAASMQGQEERRIKLQETLRNVGLLFRKLHRVHGICSDLSAAVASSQYTPIEPDVTLQSLVPMVDDPKPSEEKKPSEATRALLEERARLTEQVVLKNHQLKEVIDALRNIIWEINTMLAMRKRHLQFTHRISSQAK